MAEHLLDHFRVYVAGEHGGGEGVAQVVEADAGETCALQEGSEGAVGQVGDVYRGAGGGCEDELFIPVVAAEEQALLELALAVCLQRLDGPWGEPDRAGLVSLGRGEGEAGLGSGELAPHTDETVFRTPGEVYVLPLETQELAFPEPAVNSQDIESFQPVARFSNRFQKSGRLLRGEWPDLLLGRPRGVYGVGRVAVQETRADGLAESTAEYPVDKPDGAVGEARV